MTEKCSILFPYPNDHKDVTGCLHEHHNDGIHVFRNSLGQLIAWHEDENCNCGCWDTYEDDGLSCLIQWEVEEIFKPKY
jgi:hypothetical protein